MSFGDESTPAVPGSGALVPVRRRLLTPAVCVLAGLHVVGYVVPALVVPGKAEGFVRWFGLSPGAALLRLHVWQLVTHSFVCPSACMAWGMIWAVGALLFVGSWLETEWGAARFLAFYAVTACASGLIRALPGLAGGPVAVFGSTGVFCALIAAFGYVFRDKRLWLFFATVTAAQFAVGLLLVVALLNAAPPSELLWLSGAAAGYAYARVALGRRGPVLVRRGSPASRRARERFSGIDLDD